MNGDLTLSPFLTSRPVVQEFGTYTITLKLATSLHYDSRIYITLPANLQVDRTSSTPFSCSVQFGANPAQSTLCTLDTNLLVDMSRMFASGKNVVAGGTVVKVVISSSTQKISNPVSAKECGDWKVSTFNMIGGKEWLVDTASASDISLKFKATAGAISAGSVSIVNVVQKIASSESDTYKFDLTLPHSLPAFGKILLKLPSSPTSITIPSTAPVASSCFTYRTGSPS